MSMSSKIRFCLSIQPIVIHPPLVVLWLFTYLLVFYIKSFILSFVYLGFLFTISYNIMGELVSLLNFIKIPSMLSFFFLGETSDFVSLVNPISYLETKLSLLLILHFVISKDVFLLFPALKFISNTIFLSILWVFP